MFIHGAGDPTADDGSFRLLDRLRPTVEQQGAKCFAPTLPQPESPDAKTWCAAITEEIIKLEAGSTLLAHSVGGSCALAALASQPGLGKISYLILVATPHWGRDPNWSARSFVLEPEYAERLQHIDSIHLVYSSDDEVVPISHMSFYSEEIPQAKRHALSGVGHIFAEGDISPLENLVEDSFTPARHNRP